MHANFAMNVQQQKVCDLVRRYTESKKQILLHVSGEAGTGKSAVLKKCVEIVGGESRKCFVVAAPTGVAAHNVFGVTIHSAFKLPVRSHHVRESDLENLKSTYRSLDWLFIDEISMVSADIFLRVHTLLQQVKENNLRFGGVSVVLFGDFLQLKPVNGDWVFTSELWIGFQHLRLTSNERQSEDPLFGELCSRLRKGQQTRADADTLRKRLIRSMRESEAKEYEDAVHIFTKRYKAAERNASCSERIPNKREYVAVDTLVRRTPTGDVSISLRDEDKLSLTTSDVCDIPFKLQLGTGSRVMLRVNTNTKAGLVNGRTGTVVRAEPYTVFVCFDGSGEITEVNAELVSKDMDRGYVHLREQIPLNYCWGVTAHKVQGLTLPKAVLHINRYDLFCASLAYVMLTRVCRLSDVAFTVFDEKAYLNNRPALIALEEDRKAVSS